MSKLILASKSPRRQELMQKLRVPFLAEPAVGEEIIPQGTAAEDTAQVLSFQKAKEVFSRHAGEDVTVIGSDTVVILDGKIFGKPHSKEEAKEMLRSLSGRTHEVRTGVTILSKDFSESFTSVTEVTFYPLSEQQIASYVRSGEPMDKAGAYGIQGLGALLVRKIHGDYYTVVGFPIAEIAAILAKNGVISWE